MLTLIPLLSLASAETPSHTIDQVLRNAAAQVEVDCLIAVSTELVGSHRQEPTPTSTHYRPSRCDIATIEGELQALTPNCSRAVVRVDDWLHIGPGRESEGRCTLAETVLDDAVLDLAPGPHDLRVAGANRSAAEFFVRHPLWVEVPEGGITLRELSQLVMMKMHGPRRFTSKVEHPPEGGKPQFDLALVGGEYFGSIEVLDGPYSHRTKWWIPRDEPFHRPLTQGERVRLAEARRQERVGEITNDEFNAMSKAIWDGLLVNPPPEAPRPPDLDPGVPWPEED